MIRLLRAWFNYVWYPDIYAPDTVTAAANAIAGKPPAEGRLPMQEARVGYQADKHGELLTPTDTGDGTHVGDDPDAGAIGG